MLTTMPASASRVIWLGVTVSAATVLSRLGRRLRAAIRRDEIGLVHRPDQRRIMRALAGDAQMRTLEMQAEEARHAALAPPRRRPRPPRRSFRGVSVMRVGRQRGGAELREGRRRSSRWSATSGVRLSSTPPPPLTCRSMKPGTSMPPPSGTRCASVGESAAMMPSMRSPSTTSAERHPTSCRRRRCGRRYRRCGRSYRFRDLLEMRRVDRDRSRDGATASRRSHRRTRSAPARR